MNMTFKSYVSSAARQFAPGAFVRTWNPDLGRDAVGVSIGVEDPQEANPRVHVKWMHDLSTELVRAEYLYSAEARAFCLEAARGVHDQISRKWRDEADHYEAAAREIEAYSDRDEIDNEEFALNKAVADTLRDCITDLLYPVQPTAPEEEIKF